MRQVGTRQRLLSMFLLPALLLGGTGSADLFRCRLDETVRRTCCCPPATRSDASSVAKSCCCDISRIDLTQPTSVASSLKERAFSAVHVALPAQADQLLSAFVPESQPTRVSAFADAGPPIIIRNCSLLI